MSRRSRARHRARIQRDERAIIAAHAEHRRQNAPKVAEVFGLLCELAAHHGYRPDSDLPAMDCAAGFQRADEVAKEIQRLADAEHLRDSALCVHVAAWMQALSYDDDGLTNPTYAKVAELFLRHAREGLREVATARPELLSEASRALVAAWPTDTGGAS